VFWPQTLKVAGIFPASGWARPDAIAGRIVFLSGNRLRVFDQNSYAELGALNLSVNAGNPASLIRCGTDRVAFRTDDNRMVILRTDMIPIPAMADLSVAQSSSLILPIVGSNLTYVVAVSNAGPASAMNVVLVDQLPAGAAFVSALPSQGVCDQTNGIVNCQLNALANGASASVTVTVLTKTPGEMVNVTRVIGGILNPTNDTVSQTNIAVFNMVLPAVTEIALNAAELAYDSASNRLWASVIQNASKPENSLWAFRLDTGLNEASIPVGTEPSKIAISDNGQYIYVGVHPGPILSGSIPLTDVYRFSTRTRIKDLQFSVRDQFNQEHGVVDMAAVPGNPNAVVISRSGPQNDAVYYQDGVGTKRSPADLGAIHLEFSDSSNRLFTVSGDYGSTVMVRLNVTSNALQLVDVTGGLLVHRPDIRFANGRLFVTDGAVVDPLALTRVTALPASGFVQPDPASGQIFYLGQNPNTSEWILSSFDAATLLPGWAATLRGVSGAVSSMVRCNPGVLAFNTTGGQVFILNTALMPHSLVADLEVSFTPSSSAGPVNSPFTFTGIVRNNGPAPAINVVVTNTLSAGTVLLAQSVSLGGCTNIGGMLICQIGNLAVGGAVSFTLTAMKTNAGTLLVSALAAAEETDPFLSNNTSTFTADIIVPPAADVMVRDGFTVGPGGQFTYSIVVSNAGPDVAAGVALTDIYPDGAVVLSSATSQGTLTTNAGYISADLGSIAPGTAAVILLTVRPPSKATLVNWAEISSTTADPAPANNDSISMATPGGDVLVTKVALQAGDFVYDAVHRRLYASVPPNGGALSNNVVAIDPDTGAFTQQLQFSEPVGKLAISDDGQYLYAALTRTGGVLRIATTTGVVEARIRLPDDPNFGTRVAIDLEPIPGQPQSLAVSSRSMALGYNPGIEIYDGTTVRSNSIWVSSGVSFFFMAFPTPPNRLYANGYGGFHLLPLDSMGVTFTGPTVGGIPGTDFVLDGGLAYFDSGHVLNPDSQTIVGRFPFGTGFVAPDTASNRVLFLPQKGNPYFYSTMTVRAFNPGTFLELWSISLLSPPGLEQDIIKLRSGEFAIRTDGSRSRILIVRTNPLDVPAADISLTATDSPDPVSVGGTITSVLTLRNDGPWNATNVVVSNALAAGTAFVSANASQGSCTLSNGIVVCSIGPLANGASATVTIAVSPNVTGLLSNQFGVNSDFADPNPLNNSVFLFATVKPAPSLSIADAAVLEGNNRTPISFKLTLSSASTLPVSVSFATVDGTALAGPDYDATNGVITFSPGTTSRTLTLSPGIRGNNTVQPNRFFFINLGSPTNVVLARNQATGYVVEDDFTSVSVQSTNVLEGNIGRTNVIFSFSLMPANSNAVTVEYATLDGTATAGSDYLARGGTLLFPPGTTNQTLKIPVLGDLCNEPDETFLLQLSSPANALLIINEVTGRISNDDPVPVVRIVSFAPDGNGWRVQFSSACDRFYRLLRTQTLTPGSWLSVADQVAGTGGAVSVTDSISLPAGQAFYRIEILP
jgi:uncharacterized repeat protein (TIGR01451 family)